MITKEFQMWGNSISMRFPKEVTDQLGIHPGTRATFDIQDGKVIIAPEQKTKKIHVSRELVEWTNRFIKTYRPALEALAQK